VSTESTQWPTALPTKALEPAGGDATVPDRSPLGATLLQGFETLPTMREFAAGSRAGPYLLRRQLGAGGMGVVWLADQLEPVQRPVALKLVQRQLRGSLAEAYFQVERQALAQMSHPAIARIFDAGTLADGAMFFAMEHIEGRTLDAAFAGRTGAVALVVRTLVRICQGVQHAHQKGVIHRDLKPANILVTEIDGDLQPKIIDFGVAIGMTPGAGVAQTEGAIGTQAYMAPEQARPDGGLIDARADVYALGAVLAELLCLVSGFRPGGARGGLSSHGLRSAFSASLTGSAESAAEQVVPIRELRQIPAELRAIAVRAMAEDREQRYDSAAAMAADLSRWLRREPVQAMPDHGWYRARCFIRRHRLGLAAATGVLLALGAGLVAALYGLGEAERGRALAQIEARRAQQTSAFLGKVLSSVDPDRARDLDKTLLREVLDQAATRASTELAREPTVLAEIGRIIGETYFALGDYRPALAQYDRVLAALPPGADAAMLARLRNARISTLLELSRIEEALAEADAALADTTAALGADHPMTQRLASKRVWALYMAGELQAAAAAVTPLLATVERVDGRDGENTLYTLHTAAIVASDLGDYPRAQHLLQQLVERRTRLFGAEATDTIGARQSLGISYIQSKRFPEAIAEFESLLPVLAARHGPDHPATLTVTSNLAGALRQAGRLADSEPYYRAALEGSLRRFGAEHQRTVMFAVNMANYEAAAGQGDAALRRLRSLEARVRQHFGEQGPVPAEFQRTLARAHEARGDWRAATSAWERALALSESLLGPSHPKVAEDRDSLERSRQRLGL
jgi:non-specific serine/threonine protein kinase/serine/threonine-protein kinase